MKRTIAPGVGVALAIFCLQFAAGAQPAAQQQLQRHVPAAVGQSAAVGRLEAGRELNLALGLPWRNREKLTNLLQRIYDSTAPEYHHFLTPAQFAETFGPTEEDYRALTAFAQANGLRVTMTHSNRAVLDVAGSVSDIEKAFHVTLRTYPHPRENRLFYAPDVEPTLELGTPVLHISGLDNYALPRPMVVQQDAAGKPLSVAGANPSGGSGPSGSYMGNDFRAAYVPGSFLNGAGQVVGLLEFDDGFFPQDILNYESSNGLPNVPLKNVLLDGTTGTPGQANTEVSLDIEMAVSMCPGLSGVIVYEGMTTDDILNRMATDNLAKQLSASWTYPIDAESEQIFQQFAAQGQSFFNASGDYDAYVGGASTPSDDPYITVVGGTTLTTTGPGGSYVSETAWNWGNGIGTAGGISITYPIPSWQQGVNMKANGGSTTNRNLPDVALTADNVWVMYGDGLGGSFGGTSCATPLWAAFTALVNQQAAATGQAPVGFINPAVYALGKGANYGATFHDVTTGNNTSVQSPSEFYAVPGYDLCTGWGTPNGTNLINILAPPDPLQISPPAGFAAEGGVGGPFTTISEALALTNAGSNALGWAVSNTAAWLTVAPTSGTLTPGGGATIVTVQLNAAASNLFLGTYTATLAFTNLSDGSVQSRTFALSIIKPPVITTQPTNVTALGGNTVTFSAGMAGGLPLTGQWQLNGTNLTNGGRISGAQTTLTGASGSYGSAVCVLTISNAAAADGGNYALVAGNAAGAAVSSNALLTVTPSVPVITSEPAGQTVLIGATVQLGVAVEGSAPFAYQWRLNQTNLADGGTISGSGTPELTISNASSANIGNYTVIISNSLGSVTSTVAQVLVEVPTTGGQLVQNGGFETGSFSSWAESGNFTDCSVSSSLPAVHSGTYGALLGSAGTPGYLSQSLPTATGQVYLLSLWLDSPDGIAPNEFSVSWNGTVLFDQTNLGGVGWTNLQFYVTALSSNTALQLGFRDDQSFLGLDDIQVSPLASADGPPIIVSQPANQAALTGGAASFSVLSSGRLPLFYQWQFAGNNLTNATNATLFLSGVATNQAGVYDVVVSNSLGSATSSNALLNVLSGSPTLITFDDLAGLQGTVPAGYNNLTWENFYYLNPTLLVGPNGYAAGMVSSPNVAVNGNGAPASIVASAPFALLSAYLTAAWYDNLKVEAKGYHGSNLLYDQTYTLSATVPTLVTFNYVGVTSVQFISSGGTPHPGYNGSGEHFAMDNVSAITGATAPLGASVVYTFNGPDGGQPSAALVQGADGNFYGTTTYGGAYNMGTVFKMTTNGAVTTLASFNAAVTGSYPYGGLVQGADGNFYGTTDQGGTYGYGAVFKLTTNGVLTRLASFDYSTTGGFAWAGLVAASDGNFYGTTDDGGAYGYGTVFRVTTNGILTGLVSFDSTNGVGPYGGLVQGSDGNLYGTTSSGGAGGYGTVFRATTNGTLTSLVSFNYGSYSLAALVQGSDGYFYGTTAEGGANYGGTIFRVDTNGNLTTLVSLDYSINGGYPTAALVQGADGSFYGTTQEGGTADGGAVFKMTTNGTMSTLLTFRGANGLSPHAGLVQGTDGNFYGATFYGGMGYNGASGSGDGVVFRLGTGPAAAPPTVIAQPAYQVVPVGGVATFSVNAGGAAPLSYSWQQNGSPIAGATNTSYITNSVQFSDWGAQFSCVISNAYGSITSSVAAITILNPSGPMFSFSGSNGGYSSSALVQGADGNLYGTTAYGGASGDGTVFKLTTNGVLTTVASFNYSVTGAYPEAGLTLGTDGNFYGTTAGGGADGEGTVFRLTTNGTLTTLVSFSFFGNGANPEATLVQGADGNFYGTTANGGASYDGTVFSLTTNGTLTTLASFNSSNGAYPLAGLVQGADGNFYGTTETGGTNGFGTVFSVTTNGLLTTLVSFNSSGNGGRPEAGLVPGADGNFYGTTSEGGPSGGGTLFRVTTNGTLTTLVPFSYMYGAPHATLMQGADGNLYGTTSENGSSGRGTVFRASGTGTGLTTLFSFAGTNGLTPRAALVQGSDGNLYGTTTYGGIGYDGSYPSGNGTVFRLVGAVLPGKPLIVTQPLSQNVAAGAGVTFRVTALGSPPFNYFWSQNSVNIPGATNSAFTANNVQLSDSGSVFTCVVSNAYGTTPSSNAVLTVYLPPLLQNGGFELGNFNGWTQSGNAWGESVIGTAPFVHSGGYGAKLGPTGTLGYLSQNVATSIGQSYLISCWLNSDGLTPNEFLISWNGATLFDGVNLAASGWTNLQFLAAATATNTVLELGFRDDPGYLSLDDLSVVPASLSISGTRWSGANLVLNGSNGVSGETNYVLMSTNLALPLSQWTPVATNLLGATGNFTVTVTNAATPGNRQQFYILRLQ